MAISPSTDGSAIIQLNDEIDGEEIGSRNYRFSKIGEPVPIYSNASKFVPKFLPSQPLAVSERFRLLFVAHPHGFCVARTADVMASAEQIKDNQRGPSLLEFCLVDVSLESVSILALSADDSMLAATVGSHAYFFAVSALLNKDPKPSFSVSLDDSSCIKDIRWARKAANVFLILSDSGKLYYGSGQGPLSHVVESVDSVDWSIRGNFVAVAKKNILSILSSQLKEKLSFSLPFQSVIGDCNSDVNQLIKVDSVRWIRPDCIVVGLFQLSDDGEEENYVVQIITSREGRITDPASKPIVLSFNNLFMDFCSDAVPTRKGPHLFLSYLDLHGLAFVANRNLSRHVGLFCWPLDSGKNEAALVEILNDAWTLYVDSQGNGEENVILGLSVDKVAQNENVKLTLGDVDTEVSPSCVIICLTIDGKISVFHFASAVGASSPKYVASDEEDNAPQIPLKHEPFQISSGVGEGSGEQIFSQSESLELSRIEKEKTDAKATVTNDLSYSFQVNIQSREKTDTENVEQKSLVNSQALKLDEPTRPLPVVSSQNCNEENQSVSKVKSSTSFFSRKVVDDIPSESVRNFLSVDSSVEPFVNVESENSPSTWSVTWSNGKVDTSKTPVGRSFSLPFDKVDGSDKCTLQAAGAILRDSSEVREKAKSSATSSSFGQSFSLPFDKVDGSDKRTLQAAGAILRDSSDVRGKAKSSATSNSFGQNASTELGNMHSLLSNPVSQVPLRENVAPGKSLKSESNKDSFAMSSLNGLPYYTQNTAKQFGNVEDMAKKLDILLKEIEGKGGFTDASITSQENLVIELENDMWALSNRCRFWRGLMDKQSREVQLLLDKTIQVLVRKVYLEGIFKQDSDSKYWELWNRQKLSSELDLKRRHILNLNQEVINQLIELERHFNLLEFNKFGEDGATQRNWRASQNWHRHSRQVQPLHSLHHTMNTQLYAAEQLSECLARQMAVLSIESNGKEHDVKKKLFESIGLSYAGDAHRSPSRDETFGTPYIEEQFTNSYSVAAKEQARRNQASVAQSHQLETARRHRDSLDQNWTSFEPSKTTVKRMLLKEDYQKGTANRSSLNIDKQYLTQSQKKLEVANSALLNTSAFSLNFSGSKGTAEILAKQSNEIPSASLFQRKAGILGCEIQGSYSALSPSSILEATMTQNSELGTSELTDEKLKSNVPLTGKNYFFASESEIVPQSDTSFHLTSPADSIGSLDHSKIGFTKSTTGNLKNTRIVTDNVSESKIPFTLASAFSSTPNFSEKGLFAKNMGKPSQYVNDVSASTSPHSILDSPLPSRNILPSFSSFVSKPSAPTLFPATPSSLEASVVRKQEVPRPQTSAPSIMSFASTLSLSSPESNLSSVSFSSPFVKSESLKSLSYSPDAIYGLKNENISQMQTLVAKTLSTTELNLKIQASPSQAAITTAISDSKLEPSASSALTEFSNNLKSGSEMDFGGSLKDSLNATPMFKSDKPNAVEAFSPVATSSSGIVGSVKNVPSDASQEEEMEEEVSETDQTTELALGSLGGFGIGSTPNSTTRKPNPFGVVTLDKDMTSVTSSFTMSTPSGELFRPASFSFQPPQPPKPLHPTAVVSFSGGFSIGNPGQVSAVSGFGQPAHIGSGQQALGSVLGTFGQSRQLGTGLTGSSVAANGFGSGFTGMAAGDFGGGFASASTAGGLASASTAGGFASLAAGGGGFASAAMAGGQFAVAAASSGGGFPSAATGASFAGGGFGAFSNQQGSGVLSAFGAGSGTGRPPSELFTQMRK